MQWSPQQDAALKAISRWLREPDAPLFKLFGFAGTGKSELMREAAAMVDGEAVQMAFTGKAALVMRRKGMPRASTIHSTIYTPAGKAKGQFEKLQAEERRLAAAALAGEDVHVELKRVQELMKHALEDLNSPSWTLNLESALKGARLGQLDECSMVDERIGRDLLSFGAKLLVSGDPFQLPPVRGAGFFTNGTPDVMLTEIHRQARDNPIIHLATTVREGGALRAGAHGDSRIIQARQVEPADALSAGQILVGRNATRRASNARFRHLRGWSGDLPLAGERLICLRNNHELGILNGLMFNCLRDSVPGDSSRFTDVFVQREDGGEPMSLTTWSDYWRGGDLTHLPHYERRDAEEFDYGYAITVHKSQGSAFDNVLLFNESATFGGDWRRWLYTGITRAVDKITVVEM